MRHVQSEAGTELFANEQVESGDRIWLQMAEKHLHIFPHEF